MDPQPAPICPVCKARFRGESHCPRCHADLSRLMSLVGRAYCLRTQARNALYQGQYPRARQLARRAQRLHHTGLGQRLLQTATIAAAVRVDRGQGTED